MKEYFPLNAKEKKQEWFLLLLAILCTAIIVKGIYNQYNSIDQDNILVPFFFTCSGFFFLIYGINGVSKGNLLPKWTLGYIYNAILFLSKKINSANTNKSKVVANQIIGIIGILAASVLFTFEVIYLVRHA